MTYDRVTGLKLLFSHPMPRDEAGAAVVAASMIRGIGTVEVLDAIDAMTSDESKARYRLLRESILHLADAWDREMEAPTMNLGTISIYVDALRRAVGDFG